MKRGVITPIEILLLPIGVIVLAIAYQVITQGFTEQIVLGAAERTIDNKATMALLSIYREDYSREASPFANTKSYAKLKEFYGITNNSIINSDKIKALEQNGFVFGEGGSCVYVLMPILMYEGDSSTAYVKVCGDYRMGGQE